VEKLERLSLESAVFRQGAEDFYNFLKNKELDPLFVA
jgi:hypothetical protein